MKEINVSTIRNIIQLINPIFHKKGAIITLLLTIQSLLDFFSLAAFYPILAIAINPEVVSGNHYLSDLSNFFVIKSSGGLIILLTGLLLTFLLIKNLFVIWLTRMKTAFAFSIARDRASKAILNLESYSYENYSQLDYSKELNRLANYPIIFSNNIILPVTTIFSETLVALFLLCVVAYFNFHMLLLMAALSIPVLALIKMRKNTLRKINRTIKDKYPLLLKYVNQMIEGFLEIKMSRKQHFFQKRFNVQSNELHEAFVKEQTVQVSLTRFIEITLSVVICLVVIYSVMLQQNYQQTLLILSVYAGAGMRLIPSVNRILHAVQQINIHSYLLDEMKTTLNRPSTEKVEDTITFNESIQLNNIFFSYKNKSNVLESLNLNIHKGDKIVITGNSGEGKTTLLLIILRLLKETKGELLIDGRLLDHKDEEWRTKIGYVPQTPYLLDGTISENVAFGLSVLEINRRKVDRLIKEVGLSELIADLPSGIDTRIGERGVQLSGGQRQRIMIARALYANADILLLDEATSQIHVDGELELIELLRSDTYSDKTIILVTHKIPKTNFFNRIYSINKGKLVRHN